MSRPKQIDRIERLETMMATLIAKLDGPAVMPTPTEPPKVLTQAAVMAPVTLSNGAGVVEPTTTAKASKGRTGGLVAWPTYCDRQLQSASDYAKQQGAMLQAFAIPTKNGRVIVRAYRSGNYNMAAGWVHLATIHDDGKVALTGNVAKLKASLK